MENLIQSQINGGNFNQEAFKALDKIRNKHKQQVNDMFSSKSLKLLEMKVSQKHSLKIE